MGMWDIHKCKKNSYSYYVKTELTWIVPTFILQSATLNIKIGSDVVLKHSENYFQVANLP